MPLLVQLLILAKQVTLDVLTNASMMGLESITVLATQDILLATMVKAVAQSTIVPFRTVAAVKYVYIMALENLPAPVTLDTTLQQTTKRAMPSIFAQ